MDFNFSSLLDALALSSERRPASIRPPSTKQSSPDNTGDNSIRSQVEGVVYIIQVIIVLCIIMCVILISDKNTVY
jgi:hypothetical protein